MIYKKIWKYILIKDDSYKIFNYYRLKALKDFSNVRKGEIGGFVRGFHNLSHKGNCWIYNYARIYDNARISENARVSKDAWVYGYAQVCGNAQVSDKARVCDRAIVSGSAIVKDNTIVDRKTELS